MGRWLLPEGSGATDRAGAQPVGGVATWAWWLAPGSGARDVDGAQPGDGFGPAWIPCPGGVPRPLDGGGAERAGVREPAVGGPARGGAGAAGGVGGPKGAPQNPQNAAWSELWARHRPQMAT
jgi:hypothetical protein